MGRWDSQTKSKHTQLIANVFVVLTLLLVFYMGYSLGAMEMAFATHGVYPDKASDVESIINYMVEDNNGIDLSYTLVNSPVDPTYIRFYPNQVWQHPCDTNPNPKYEIIYLPVYPYSDILRITEYCNEPLKNITYNAVIHSSFADGIRVQSMFSSITLVSQGTIPDPIPVPVPDPIPVPEPETCAEGYTEVNGVCIIIVVPDPDPIPTPQPDLSVIEERLTELENRVGILEEQIEIITDGFFTIIDNLIKIFVDSEVVPNAYGYPWSYYQPFNTYYYDNGYAERTGSSYFGNFDYYDYDARPNYYEHWEFTIDWDDSDNYSTSTGLPIINDYSYKIYREPIPQYNDYWVDTFIYGYHDYYR